MKRGNGFEGKRGARYDESHQNPKNLSLSNSDSSIKRDNNIAHIQVKYTNANCNEKLQINKTEKEDISKLKCFYVNARSIVYKMSELELYILEEKPDIIGITESWAFSDLQNSELHLEGYILLRKDRILGEKVKGGVCYYISTMLFMQWLGKIFFQIIFKNAFGVSLQLIMIVP